jgi:transcriptional regulator with XRE-family HTH domain
MKSIEPVAHHGRNIKRLRELQGIKQDIFAEVLGLSQASVSRLEGQETVDDETLERIAKILKVPMDAIRNLTDENAVNVISNTFHDGSFIGNVNHYSPTFNPLDKIVELYERLLKEKDYKISQLEQLLKLKN